LIAPILKEQPNTKLITIFFGTNDMNRTVPGIFVPIGRFEENIRYIVEYCKNSDLKIIVIGPTIVDELRDPNNLARDTLLKLQYAQIAERVAEDYDVGYLDLYHAFLYALGWKEGDPLPGKRGIESKLSAKLSTLLTDGTHFTGQGYRVFYNALTAAIAKHYPELKPENISRKFPHHGDIDPNLIRRSLGLEFSTSTNGTN
jgi:isoamyl acetate esterase